ncbi:MAG: hypothetical protein U0Q07_13130 [Acidimicrobiales bacterium]
MPTPSPLDLGRVAQLARRRGATRIAAEALVTEADWFDGLDPSIAWVLVWLEREVANELDPDLTGDGARTGYRLGRLVLGVEDHPDLAGPEWCDTRAELLYERTAESCTPALFSTLASDLYRALSLCACRLVHRHGGDDLGDDEALVHEAAALASLLSGLVLSLLEAELASR